MGTTDMRNRHDTVPDWIFEYGADKAPFDKGTIRMDREDIRLAMDMFYREMGWDTKTGSPGYDVYRKFGLEEVARELKKKDLVKK
jgi:aldehyde:ferredoxin oxidoreductase